MKRIYIDGLGLVDGHFSGVGHYILGVLRGLDSIIDTAKYQGEPFPEIRVIVPYDMVAKFRSFGFKYIGYKKVPLRFRYMSALWHRRKLPPIDLWCGRGIYIFPRFVSMPLLFSQSALVIYDLSYELHRQYSDEGNARFLSAQVKYSLKTTQKVITISQNARKEILEFYNLKPERVVVATPATDPSVLYRRSRLEVDQVKRRYGIKNDYILALSNLEPRKNLDALVDAYCALPKSYRKDLSLLLVGVSGWKTDDLFKKIVAKVQEGYDIIRPTHYVSDEDLPAIISGAQLLAYPSHYEGFGMPPLEALACGVPVITADNSSLPEVVGDAARMVRSDDPDGLLQAITESLADCETLTARTAIEGPRQAEKFAWERSAQTFLDVAKELAG